MEIGDRVVVEQDSFMYGVGTFSLELIELVDGDEAWNMIKVWNEYNDPAEEGMEYVLAKLEVEVLEAEEEPIEINHARFDAISGQGVEYDEYFSISGVDPNLRRDVYEGGKYEGWTYFMIDVDDDGACGVFSRKYDHEVWFSLRSD
jgi:hypothetical protein